MPPLPLPPVARRDVHRTTHHGVTLEDPYHWLRDPGYPEVSDAEVLDYLKAENHYFDTVMAPHRPLVDTIFAEMKARLKEDDSSVPQRDGAFIYQTRFAVGEQYPRLIRWPAGERVETVLIDQPALAAGHAYFRLGSATVSNNDRLIAYSTDVSGSERYTLRIKDIASGEHLPETITDTIGPVVWQSDDSAFAYMELSPEWRPWRVKLHRLGTDPAEDAILFEEADAGFFTHIERTQSRRFMLVSTGDNITSEQHLVPTGNLAAPPLCIAPRRAGHQYDADEREGELFIRTNDSHVNFRLVRAPVAAPQEANWREVIAPSDKHYLTGHVSFGNLLVIEERIDGLEHIRLRSYDGNERRIAFPEASYTVSLAGNPEVDVQHLRLAYASMVTPATVYDYELATGALIVRKVQEIPSGYDASLYATERLLAPARDGTWVPVSLVYRKDRGRNGGPLHLYAYGSYGHAIPPGFSTLRLLLLDRGFAYAIAHVRGGDDLGYNWYLAGKARQRWNTFNDFIDVAQHLIREGFTAPKRISAEGRSAGGQLMGAITNAAPELWAGVIAGVPFVDVINTMVDDSLPLTPMEWPEWGNPLESSEDFNYMLSYSPYDNVTAKAYPPLLITGGLNDPRVTYWEPAKWAARIRHERTNDALLLLKTEMGAGHGGKSGRYESLIEDAEATTFLMIAHGLV